MNDERIYTNIERFIHEISTRPCIWNPQCNDYKDKNKRRIAWEQICRIFFSSYDSKNRDRKEHLSRRVQKKWKSIRDTYVRNLRKNGSAKYAHSNSLNFLRDSVKFCKPLDTQIEHNADENSASYIEQEEEIYCDEEVKEEDALFENKSSFLFLNDSYQSSNSNTSINLEIQALTNEPNSITFQNSEQSTITSTSKSAVNHYQDDNGCGGDDEDRLFLLSLVKDLKKISEYNKLEAKSEILLVLNKWKKSSVQVWCP